ncbi:hypothetical protein GCM10011374_36800 [Kocuria dechangensis]|uniref:Uncharacterized protein n=1 Tax=Kocuria dechangensis TaxID=1176249 RepID=A0A917M1D0_9MICC|nr:hypothetical protein GCM10011374_36800 [Kocuria dechangensis]
MASQLAAESSIYRAYGHPDICGHPSIHGNPGAVQPEPEEAGRNEGSSGHAPGSSDGGPIRASAALSYWQGNPTFRAGNATDMD